MNHPLTCIALAGLLLAGCATDATTDTVRRDDAYVPIGSNIPRKDRKPEDAGPQALPPGAFIPGPAVGPRN